jgi:hypothetical protein
MMHIYILVKDLRDWNNISRVTHRRTLLHSSLINQFTQTALSNYPEQSPR